MLDRMAEWLRVSAQPSVRRDVDMMALSVCVALLAALSFGSEHEPHSKLDVLAVVWATTVGLVLTHIFALWLAVRLNPDPTFTVDLRLLLGIQLLISVVIAAVTTAVVLVAASEVDRLGARIAAAAFLGLFVAAESRRGGSTGRRAAAWGVGASAAGLGLATTKWYIGS